MREAATWNLLFAWTWILAGFISGMLLGAKFHNEQWLGGYASHKRRLLRLGHISFFGLGLINFMFYLTASSLQIGPGDWKAASLAFIIGGLTMPICCALMALNKRLHMIFSVPVISLLIGVCLTLRNILSL